MKMSYISILALVVFIVAGCVTNPSRDPSADPTDTTPFTVAKSVAVSRETVQVPTNQLTEQATSTNAFAVKMYQQLLEGDNNMFFSPYSITAALAMTSAGAGGTTREQMREALQVTLEGDAFDAAINGIEGSLTKHANATDGVTLRIVNSTWMQSNWDFKLGYLDHLSRYYGAGVNLMDFATKPDECRTVINTWVADQTNNKIENLLPEGTITPTTVLVLTNAIYFLGDWLYNFNPHYTTEGYFFLPDDSTIHPEMMYYDEPGKKVTMRYSRVGNARALDIPYKGDRLAMTVLLPDHGELTAFEDTLSLDVIDQLIETLDSTELLVALPKWEFTFGAHSLKNALTALGMNNAFIPGGADLSGIDGSSDLFVTDVLHKAFISVDEEGTEAAAATAVTVGTTSADPDEQIFIVNRPFIYVIRDTQTGIILFMGRTVDPTLTN